MVMDFEEGEVDDVSDSEFERSPVTKAENIQVLKRRGHSKHSRHRMKRKHPKSANAATNRNPVKPTKPNGHCDGSSNADSGLFDRPRHRNECISLKDFLSEDESDQVLAKKHAKRPDPEGRHRKRRRKVERFSKPTVHMQCRYFKEGRCSKGDSCPFAHDFEPPKKQELCKFYAVGVCSKGPNCVYLHGEFPCKFFHLSGRCNHGSSCKFSHDRLTSETQVLLDNAMRTREFSPETERPVRSASGFPSFGDHGDVDYRFSRRPLFGQPVPRNYDSQSAQSSHQDFESSRPPFNGFRESRNLLGPRPSFDFRPCDAPTFGPEDHFGPNAPVRLPGSGYPPPRFPIARPLDAPYPPNLPGFLPPERALLMRPPINHGSGINPHDLVGPSEFPSFRPFCPAPTSVPIPSFTPAIMHPPTDVLVNSELDKMAALLASSKPPPTSSNCPVSPPSDPRAQSPVASSKSEKLPLTDVLQSPTSNAELLSSTLESPGTQFKRTSLSIGSPELNIVTNKPSAMIGPPLSTSWRLIQLDMNVKIPYPLMQLPIEDLPYRFEDPRLRGQLTTLRPQTKPVSATVVTDLGLSTPVSELSTEANTTENVERLTPSSKRRPIKLQLNEMASTFANVQAALTSNPPTKSGDRSYLDDPRFRRRRIIAVTTSSQVPSAPSDASCVTSE